MSRKFPASLPQMGISREMYRALRRLSEVTGAPVAFHVRSALTAHLNDIGLLLDSETPDPEPSGRRVYHHEMKEKN